MNLETKLYLLYLLKYKYDSPAVLAATIGFAYTTGYQWYRATKFSREAKEVITIHAKAILPLDAQKRHKQVLLSQIMLPYALMSVSNKQFQQAESRILLKKGIYKFPCEMRQVNTKKGSVKHTVAQVKKQDALLRETLRKLQVYNDTVDSEQAD